jgi:hypothetical protein
MSKVISTEVSDELLEEIDAERDGEPPDYDESRSSAVRRLLRAGIEAEKDDSMDVFVLAFVITGVMGTLLALSGELSPLATVLSVTILLAGIGANFYGHKVDLP